MNASGWLTHFDIGSPSASTSLHKLHPCSRSGIPSSSKESKKSPDLKDLNHAICPFKLLPATIPSTNALSFLLVPGTQTPRNKVFQQSPTWARFRTKIGRPTLSTTTFPIVLPLQIRCSAANARTRSSATSNDPLLSLITTMRSTPVLPLSNGKDHHFSQLQHLRRVSKVE